MSVSTIEQAESAPVRTLQPPYATLTVVALLVIWQAVTYLFAIPSFLLPSPVAIAVDLGTSMPLLWPHIGVTVFEVLIGFLVSVLIAVPLAIAITSSTVTDRAIYPLIVGSQTIPKVAIAPLLLAWLGFGLAPKIAIVVLITFFPVVINSVVGLRSAPSQMLNLARSMGATRNQTFWRFLMPQALPSIFAGLKLSTVLAVTGAVVGEFVGADAGLGYVILVAASNFQIDRQFSAIILLCVIGIIFFELICWIERKVIPWHISVRGEMST